MAKYKATWIALDGKIFDTERQATEYEAGLQSLGLKEYFGKVLKIKLSAVQVDMILKLRKPLIKLLQNEARNNTKGQKSTKTTN